MKRHPVSSFVLLSAMIFLLANCNPSGTPSVDLGKDQILQCVLADIRLGDGVPVNLALNIRWQITKESVFLKQFSDPNKYSDSILKPKSREIIGKITNEFPSVEAVFKTDRQKFIQAIKTALVQSLGEDTIAIKEVILSDIIFPQKFTEALEQVSLKDREVEAIKETNVVDLESAKAAESKAEADGKVEIKQAEMEGKVAEINAKAEEHKRLASVAKAETDALVSERKGKAQAENERQLSKVKVEEEKAIRDLDVQKQRDLDTVALEKDKAIAQLCSTNPSYANFMISRELASKVQIAVVPTNGDSSNFLGGLLQNFGTKSDQKASK
jgi:hypothetical protein